MTPTLRKVNFNDELLLSLSYDEDTGKASVTIEVLKDSEPIYKKFLQDGSEIAVDKQKFESLSYIEQLYSVVEESMVVAYERKLSLINGFKHVYTKLSKNWWNDFITANFVVIISFLTEFNKYFKETSKHGISI